MKGLGRVIGLTMLLIGLLSGKVHPSSCKVQTYVSIDTLISSLQPGYSSHLFAQQMEDSIRVERSDFTRSGDSQTLKPKEPYTAFLYAVAPGVIIHGAGHFYAGATTTGWILVAGEIISLPLLTYAIGVGIGESTNGSSSNGDAEIIGMFAGTLFIGTWIYDLIDAPLAVRRQNQKLLWKQNLGFQFGFERRTESAKIQIIKRF